MKRRDLVVIGASAGGVDALLQLTAALPGGFPASIIVVQHVSALHESRLPELLNAHGALRAHHALHGEKLERGEIIVAPPDNHVLVRPGYLTVVRGPKENGHRPSVDALFRSAAAAYGSRTIGVVLTGQQDCGTAGLLSIKARGGVAVVQDPREAAAPAMPASAVAHVDVDHVVKLADLPALLERLVREPAPAMPEAANTEVEVLDGNELGDPADFVCPICHGRLTEIDVNGFTQFRCHVGHAFSLESAAAEQAEEVERALWEAVRALEESASLASRMTESARGSPQLQAKFEERARTQRQQADVIRELLISGGALSKLDAAKLLKKPTKKK